VTQPLRPATLARESLPASRAPAIAALTMAAVFWGSAAVAAKTVLETLPPFVLAEIRWIIAIGLIWPLVARAGERPVLTRQTAALGLTGLALFYLFYSYGLRSTTAASATLIGGGAPVLVALLSARFLGERISERRIAGVALSLVGVAAIVLGGSGIGGSLKGNLLMVGSTLSWAVYIVLGRKVVAAASPMAVLAGTAIFGLLLMVPPAVVEIARGQVGAVDARDVLLVLYLAIGPSALAYLLWGFGLSRVEASQASVYGQLMPLVGVVSAAIFLGESITLTHVVGGGAIILGVALATQGKQPA
jgi:drug/metabolite transporter (DMT)-like permease